MGCDGCGKSTQIRRCVEWIREKYKVPCRIVTRFDLLSKELHPEFAFANCSRTDLAEHYLPMMKGHARAVFLMYTFALAFGSYPPSSGEIVLVDGYWHKNLATEGALGINQEWFENMCAVLPKPDVTLFFDIDPFLVIERGRRPKPYECGCDFSCSNHSFVKHQSKMRTILLHVARKYKWFQIDASRSEDDITLDVQRTLEPLVSKLAKKNQDFHEKSANGTSDTNT